MRLLIILLLLGLSVLSHGTESADETSIDLFYKNMSPSLQTLAKVLPVVLENTGNHRVMLHDIHAPETAPLIERYHLPDTHFPFAVVINGHFSVGIDGRQAAFVHFPLFMKGIGRHEGNWSLDDLRYGLAHPEALLETNVPPELPETEEEPCPE